MKSWDITPARLANIALLAESPDGAWLLIADESPMGYRPGRAICMSLATSSPALELGLGASAVGVGEVQWSPDSSGVLVATRADVATWSRWEPADQSRTWKVEAPWREMLEAHLGTDRKALAREELDHLEEVVSDHGMVLGAINADGATVAGSSHPTVDSALLLEETLNRRVFVWDTAHEGIPRQLVAGGPVLALAFEASGEVLAVGMNGGAVELRDHRQGTMEGRLEAPASSRPLKLLARPDGGFFMAMEFGEVFAVERGGSAWTQLAQHDGLVDLAIDPRGEPVTLAVVGGVATVESPGQERLRVSVPEDVTRFGALALTPRGDALLMATSSTLWRAPRP